MKRFPILNFYGHKTISWGIAQLAYEEYSRQFSGQSLERIAQRGGFGMSELKLFLPAEIYKQIEEQVKN